MKTQNGIAFTTQRGTKHTTFECSQCRTMVRTYGTAYRIYREKIGIFCSEKCIDDYKSNNKGQTNGKP